MFSMEMLATIFSQEDKATTESTVEKATMRSVETLEMTILKVAMALESCLAVKATTSSKEAMPLTQLLEVLETTGSGLVKAMMSSLVEMDMIKFGLPQVMMRLPEEKGTIPLMPVSVMIISLVALVKTQSMVELELIPFLQEKETTRSTDKMAMILSLEKLAMITLKVALV